ncbi:MAG: xanthine dehydrogenase family protein molybdopterin-binding subunit [bacterium]|nr:xanthine dehydrogenase family protein molybdopterin-binding subunit [bacterium]
MAQTDELKTVGKRTSRLNGPDIVTGRIGYADDVQVPGMLYGRILRSPHGHARILKIDVSKALALPGVVDVVTGQDVPDTGFFAGDEVCYHGQKVGAVAATDPDIAEDALELIQVDYEVLPAVVDPLMGLAPDAPEAQLGASSQVVNGKRLPNVTSHAVTETGDVEKGFAESDAVVEYEYRVPMFHQTYLEPNAATARVEANGRLTVWTSSQGMFGIRDGLAEALGIPQSQVRVILQEMGGGFGAKNRVNVEGPAAVLALRTGQPVKVTINREEVFMDGRPAPGCWIRLKTGARKDGTLMAVEGQIVWDGGIEGRSGNARRLLGLYKVPNVRIEAFSVRTNKPVPGAYRAPGAPQTALARESNIDMVAHKLGMDPIEFRLKNAIGKGEQPGMDHDWLKDTIRQTAEKARWGRRRLKRNQGMGIACGEWQNGSGPTHADITMRGDGSVTVLTGQADITGVHTVMAQVVAEELDVPVEKVTVTLGDTDTVAYTSLSAGSKAAYSASTVAREAAENTREEVLKRAAAHLEASVEDLVLADEVIRVKGSPGQSVSLAELAEAAIGSAAGPITGRASLGSLKSHPSFSVNIATVEVDPETGRVKLIDLVAAQDVGRALNPMLVEGQIQGGAVQSVGFGLMEGIQYDDQGRVLNPNLLDYAIPTALDVPDIQTVIVEEPCEHGPYGSKGVGEPPIIPGGAAVANAIYSAVGARVTEVPTTPERVVAALKDADSNNR